MMPACTGPTGIWKTPSPVTGRKGWECPPRAARARGREVLPQGPRALGPVVVQRDARRVGMALGARPKKSMTSRSNQFAAGCAPQSRESDGRRPVDRGRQRTKSASRGSDQTWWTKNARPGPLVGGEERQRGAVQSRPARRPAPGSRRRDLEHDLARPRFARASSPGPRRAARSLAALTPSTTTHAPRG